jgi:hypothetical protein
LKNDDEVSAEEDGLPLTSIIISQDDSSTGEAEYEAEDIQEINRDQEDTCNPEDDTDSYPRPRSNPWLKDRGQAVEKSISVMDQVKSLLDENSSLFAFGLLARSASRLAGPRELLIFFKNQLRNQPLWVCLGKYWCRQIVASPQWCASFR